MSTLQIRTAHVANKQWNAQIILPKTTITVRGKTEKEALIALANQIVYHLTETH